MRRTRSVVYAVVQSDEGGTSGIDNAKSKAGGVFRSEDGGETWTRMSPLNPRPFYFSQIRVDPQNDQRVYVLGFMLHVSDDGGRTFREDLFKNVHADCHALAIVPPPAALVADAERAAAEALKKAEPGAPPPPPVFSRHLVLGTDGGVYQSFDAGGDWDHLDRIAAGQYYRINVDDSVPYRICGGLQDNTNWLGPSGPIHQGGDPQRRLDRDRRRRRLLLRLRPVRPRRPLRRVPGGLPPPLQHPDRRAQGPAPRADRGPARASASTGTRR